MKTTRSLVLALALVFAWATAGFAAYTVENCGKRVESFNYLVDYSGSMMMGYQSNGTLGNTRTKLALAREAINRVNSAVPTLNFQGGLYTFAPYNAIVPQGPWTPAPISEGLATLKDNFDTFARFTPMGDGIQAHVPVINAMTPREAIILVTDGATNRGSDPVAEVRAIYEANPNVCFHVISVADTPDGKATVAAIGALNNCSVVVDAVDLVESNEAVDKFIGEVFCEEAIEVVEDVVVLRGVNFAFDSDKLDGTSEAILVEAARIINERGDSRIRLQGWTDSIGSDAYNLNLSQRRANAVKRFLVAQGVNANRITAVGRGKSFTNDNSTEEGRYLNRRTELVFED